MNSRAWTEVATGASARSTGRLLRKSAAPIICGIWCFSRLSQLPLCCSFISSCPQDTNTDSGAVTALSAAGLPVQEHRELLDLIF